MSKMDDDLDTLLLMCEDVLKDLHYLKRRIYHRHYYKRKQDNRVIKRKMKKKITGIEFNHEQIVVEFE